MLFTRKVAGVGGGRLYGLVNGNGRHPKFRLDSEDQNVGIYCLEEMAGQAFAELPIASTRMRCDEQRGSLDPSTGVES